MFEPNSHSTLVTGANGYVGRLIVGSLIKSGRSNIVLLVRGHHHPRHIVAALKEELSGPGNERLVQQVDSLTIMPFSPEADDSRLVKELSNKRVGEIIHAAGSVDYFDAEKLRQGNVVLTERLLSLGKQLDVKRFVYISTAFSCGYTNDLVHERLHPEPEYEPTEYTRSKRQAEVLVTTSELPYLIVRPSIVIGDSQSGKYKGKPYGLYQLWTAAEKFMTDRYREELHVVAPEVRLQVIHQDSFQESFMAACEDLPVNSFVHLVSGEQTLPTVRDVFTMWIKACHRPQRLYFYDRIEDAPVEAIDRRLKIWLEFTSVNAAIAAHPWHFETRALDELRSRGLKFHDATIDTVAMCQQRFVNESVKLQKFLSEQHDQLAHQVDIIEQARVN